MMLLLHIIRGIRQFCYCRHRPPPPPQSNFQLVFSALYLFDIRILCVWIHTE
jgi:hypothetical protein